MPGHSSRRQSPRNSQHRQNPSPPLEYKSITPHVETLLTPSDQKQSRQKKNQTPNMYQQQKLQAQINIQMLNHTNQNMPMSLQPVFLSHSH